MKRLSGQLQKGKPLRELVFEHLREAIVSGELPPGERLREIQLANQLGVSRTPVREALRKLEREGFVKNIPHKGAHVAGLSPEDIQEVFEIRAAMEGLAASLAAERRTIADQSLLDEILADMERAYRKGAIAELVAADTRFHRCIFSMSKNRRLEGLMNYLWEQVKRYRARSLALPQRGEEILQDHRFLVDAIARGAGERARRLATAHVMVAKQYLLQTLAQEDSAGKGSEGGDKNG